MKVYSYLLNCTFRVMLTVGLFYINTVWMNASLCVRVAQKDNNRRLLAADRFGRSPLLVQPERQRALGQSAREGVPQSDGRIRLPWI